MQNRSFIVTHITNAERFRIRYDRRSEGQGRKADKYVKPDGAPGRLPQYFWVWKKQLVGAGFHLILRIDENRLPHRRCHSVVCGKVDMMS
jgi:hypothetical protein